MRSIIGGKIFIFNPPPNEQSSGRCIHRYLSVCADSSPSLNFFDIGISYLALGSITKRRCFEYIHDPDTALTFDLKVNGVLDMAVC